MIFEISLSVEKYEIRGLPTLMIFKDGKLVDTKEGFVSKKDFPNGSKKSASFSLNFRILFVKTNKIHP